jgi:hypothetical protein
MRTSEIECRSYDTLAAALIAIDPPADVLQRLLDTIDPEIREFLVQSLQAARFRRESERSTAPAT